MSIKEQLQSDLKTALKAKDKTRLNVIRMLISDIKYAELAEKKEFEDEDIFIIINKSIKKRNETIEQLKNAERDDLLKNETEELDILKEYQPEQLSDEELLKIVEDVAKEVEAVTIKDMGKVMGKIMPLI